MKKIAVFSGTRADFGLLYWLIKEIENDKTLKLQLIISGSHLSPEYGLTKNYIKKDKIKITETIETLISSNTAVGSLKSMGLGIISYSETINRLKPDIIVILGDRYEALAIAQVALILKVPILHIHGGDVSYGAYDDSIRHAITKLSSIHCVANKVAYKRVLQLGENKKFVFNVGAPGLEYIKRVKFLSKSELNTIFKFNFDLPYFLITFHPETLSDNKNSLEILLKSLESFRDFNMIFTYPNVDDGSFDIINRLSQFQKNNIDSIFLIKSFGHINYLSVMKSAELIIGNSSSGIIEAPSMNIPSINLGDRQKGRVAANSVFHCKIEKKQIISTIKKALDIKLKSSKGLFINPYGDGLVSKKIINIIKNVSPDKVKVFIDV